MKLDTVKQENWTVREMERQIDSCLYQRLALSREKEEEAKELLELEKQIDLLEKSILSKAFRGELGTNDQNDEPAMGLLKRVLEEKK